jgi:hypothetical protein
MTLSVTINAHQLGLLIDKTSNHMGSEDIEQLHGIRLDVDARYLHAVASDRYTLAVARYGLNHDDTDQEPWARTIPGEHLPALREWVGSHKGAAWITIEAGEDRLVFDSPQTTYSVAVTRGQEYPDWRGILRTLTENTVDSEPFPAFRTPYLVRFGTTENILRVRLTADMKAALLFGEDFIGAVMPARYAGIAPAEQETFATAFDAWRWTLAAGAKGVDMADLPMPEPYRYEATKDVSETTEGLLQEVLHSGNELHDTDYKADHALWDAYIRIGAVAWMAYRYLDALHNVDPRAARKVVEDTAEQLDSGEIGEWAWDSAEEAGFDPKKWDDDYEKAVADQRAKSAPEWAVRMAKGLNEARLAGIEVRVDDNPHVTFDAEAEEWVAVKPQPAENAA